jgi:hypothetical protein
VVGEKRRASWGAEEWLYSLMLAPAVVALVAVVLVPLGYLAYTSLLEWKLTDPAGRAFVGVANTARRPASGSSGRGTRTWRWSKMDEDEGLPSEGMVVGLRFRKSGLHAIAGGEFMGKGTSG